MILLFNYGPREQCKLEQKAQAELNFKLMKPPQPTHTHKFSYYIFAEHTKMGTCGIDKSHIHRGLGCEYISTILLTVSSNACMSFICTTGFNCCKKGMILDIRSIDCWRITHSILSWFLKFPIDQHWAEKQIQKVVWVFMNYSFFKKYCSRFQN